MNKTFKRAVSSVLASAMAFSSVTVATVSTTLPFTAVQAFAADSNFNLSSSTLTFEDYTDSALTSASEDTVVTPTGAANTLTALAAGAPVFVNYTSSTATSKGYLTEAAADGPLAGTIFTKAVTSNNSVKAKDVYKISGVKKGDTVGIYYVFTDSKGATGKPGTVTLTAGTATATATLEDKTYKSAPAYLTVTADADCDVIIKAGTTSTKARLGIVAFTVSSASGGDDTTTTTEATTATDASTETTTEASTETTTEGSTETTTAAANWQIKADTAPSPTSGEVVYEANSKVFANDYADVYAAQNLKVKDGSGTYDDRTYSKKFRTSGGNTTIDGTKFRLAFKVVAKQSTRVSADPSNSAKDYSIFLYDESTNEYTNLTGKVKGKTIYADLDAGQVAYIGGAGTDDSLFAVDIKKGPTPVTVTTNLTFGNAAATVPAGASVTIGGQAVTVGENGSVEFNGKTFTNYTVSYEVNGCRYESTLSIDDNGNVTTSLNLPQVSADATVTVKTANGTAVANKKITLTYYDGVKPVCYTATTDENGVATFPGLDFNTYNVAIGGYISTTETFAPVEGNIALTINDATEKSYPSLPAGASNDNLYVGYTPNSTVTTTYDSVQDAVDNATAGQTIYVAAGTYKELVTITKDIKIVGNSADDTIITYNDSQDLPNKFHGDTVVINGSVNVEFENIQIKNTAEADLGVTANATALSACYQNQNATITLNNCAIRATRDTVYTGKTTANNKWTFNNCTIAGFQDVVCGTGDVTLNNCTWELSLSSDARFLVPNSSLTVTTKMVANNLTINDTTDTGFTAKTYLGRGWGTSGCSLASTQVIVNGYTDNSGTLVTDGVYHGYDTSLANNDGTTLADTNWLVRAKQNENYYTTNRDLDTVAINTLQTPVTKDEDGDYLFKGVVNNSLLAKADYIGFAVFNADGTFVGNTKNDTVYRVTGEEGDNLYTVNYFKNMPAEGCIVKGFVQYDGVNIMNEVSNQTVTAE